MTTYKELSNKEKSLYNRLDYLLLELDKDSINNILELLTLKYKENKGLCCVCHKNKSMDFEGIGLGRFCKECMNKEYKIYLKEGEI